MNIFKRIFEPKHQKILRKRKKEILSQIEKLEDFITEYEIHRDKFLFLERLVPIIEKNYADLQASLKTLLSIESINGMSLDELKQAVDEKIKILNKCQS